MRQLTLTFVMMTTLCLSWNTLKAQNSLGFERPIFTELGGSLPDSISFTIPLGKTWKITSASVHGGSYELYLNNKMIANSQGSIWGNNPCPIWLPSGSYILQSSGGANAFISGIEFVIIP